MAEIRYGFEIWLSRGMLARTVGENERAFLLAHELAHLRLGHRPPRNAGERLPLELEADAWAAARLGETGFDARAGVDLLQRLRDEFESLSLSPAPPRATDALNEYRQRIDSLPP
nr:M48 family metalloprotease [Lysobacter sp. CAU 1642]